MRHRYMRSAQCLRANVLRDKLLLERGAWGILMRKLEPLASLVRFASNGA